MKIGRIVQCYMPIADSATLTLESRSTIHHQAERVIYRGALLQQQTMHTYAKCERARVIRASTAHVAHVANAKTNEQKSE
jgi:hypothetical protein